MENSDQLKSIPDKPEIDVESSANFSAPANSVPPVYHSKNPLYLSLIIIIIFLGGLLFAISYFQSQFQKSNPFAPSPSTSVSESKIRKLIVGIDPTLQPMEYIENGKVIGYDVDLATFLGKELGAQVEFKNIIFDDLFVSLENKKIDMIISAVTINSERQKKYDFSDEYLNAGQVIIVKRLDNSIRSTSDLKNKRIAAQKGTTNEEEAKKYTSDNLIIRFPDFEQATKALVNGNVEALFTDLPNAKGITLTNPSLKIASDPFTNEYYGIVFRKGDPVVKPINDALSALRIKGILTDLKQKWLD